MELCTLASGSSGNAVLVFDNDTALLFDAGISAKRICDGLKQLGLSAGQLDGICITHSHSDHISGLRVLLKRTDANIYATGQTASALERQVEGAAERIEIIHPQEEFQLGDLSVQAFNTPHDAPGSVGYTVSNRDRKCSIVTDLGFVTEEVRESILGSQLALVEANHDVDWLMSGPYPPYLKHRILGDGGHLSNEASGELCCELAEHGTEKLVLAHLSHENNTPERARTVVCGMLARRGLDSVSVTVAPRQNCCDPIEV